MDDSLASSTTEKSKSYPKVCLKAALELFENPQTVYGTPQWEDVGRMLTELRTAGALVPIKYLEHMQLEWQHPFSDVPELGLALSQSFFEASTAFKNYKKSKSNTSFKKLSDLIYSGNTHALSCMRKLCSTSDAKENSRIFNQLKTSNNLKPWRLKTFDDIYKNFDFRTNEFFYGSNLLDLDNLYIFYSQGFSDHANLENNIKKAIKTFNKYYDTNPHSIGSIALQVGELKCFYAQTLWAHLAIENGFNLGSSALACKLISAEPTVQNQEFSRYYVSQIREKNGKYVGGDSNYGNMYHNQRVFYKKQANFRTARFYGEKALEYGDIETQLMLGSMYYAGEGGPKDHEQAFNCFKMGAEKNHPVALLNYSIMLEAGEGCEKNLEESLKCLQKAMEGGNIEAKRAYAHKLYLGSDVAEDKGSAFKLYQECADQGDAEAHNLCGEEYINGELVEQDLDAALRHFEQAAKKGYVPSKSRFAEIVLKQKRSCENDRKARQFLKELTKSNEATVEEYLVDFHRYADMCVQGWGGPIEAKKALESYQLIMNHSVTALHNCGVIFLNYAEDTDLAKKEARQYFEQAARLGHSGSQLNYALMCHKGEGGKKDPEEVHKYCLMAANQGVPQAIILLDKLEKERSLSPIQTRISDEESSASEAKVVISLPVLEESSEEEEEEAILPEENVEPAQEMQQAAAQLQVVVQPVATTLQQVEKKELQEELETYRQVEAERQAQQRDAELQKKIVQAEQRAKKQLEQETARQTRTTLKVNKKDYDVTGDKYITKIRSQSSQQQSVVKYETLELVKTIFGQGKQKMNAFDNMAAQQAFSDLGCGVKNKEGENSTSLSFELEEGRLMKFKYHNPHPDNLYDALKPYMKRFLMSINKTPEALRLK